MKTLYILKNYLYFEPKTGEFSLSPFNCIAEDGGYLDIEEIVKKINPRCYYFCLEISNACNLNCDYCFNKNKNGDVLSFNKAVDQLEFLFERFPDGDKYYVDLSGKGEPLLNLQLVVNIANYCRIKSNQKRVEIIPMLVSNGTLLTFERSKLLQNNGVLFGVSLDGNRENHDKHRRTIDDKPTFDTILKNVASIENLDYVGCAITLTNNVFDLKKSLIHLSTIFKTISYRFARGVRNCLDKESVQLWINQYDDLASFLLKEAIDENLEHWLPLLNGDDCFGRYLCLALTKSKTINRCDGGISRFAIDSDNRIYPCSAATCCDALEIKNELSSAPKINLIKQARICEGCSYKCYCGGECQVELMRIGHPNENLCMLKKHMINLAFYLSLRISKENKETYETLKGFVLEKRNRQKKNDELDKFLKDNGDLSFTEGKAIFDNKFKKY